MDSAKAIYELTDVRARPLADSGGANTACLFSQNWVKFYPAPFLLGMGATESPVGVFTTALWEFAQPPLFQAPKRRESYTPALLRVVAST